MGRYEANLFNHLTWVNAARGVGLTAFGDTALDCQYRRLDP